MDPLKCFNKIISFEFDNKCITLLISKLLGYSIIAFSFIFKVPQIFSMIKLKNDEGLSYISMYLEIILYLSSSLYSFHVKAPFSTYGENVVIFVQSLIILVLAWKYTKIKISYIEKLIFLIGMNILIYICLQDKLLSNKFWDILGSSSIPLITVSRISQIFNSFKFKSTGSLSLFTFSLGFFGNIARIFTTLAETSNLIILFTYIYGAVLNLIIIFQILSYGNKKETPVKEKNQ